MNKLNVGLISLGCDKNRIDSEILIYNLSQNFNIVNDPKTADIIIVNTCAFIESAKQESIETILEMAEYKSQYKCKLLIASGCLTQRYKDELLSLMPEIDIILGVNDYSKINDIIFNYFNHNTDNHSFCSFSDNNINEGKRVLSTPPYYAYIRIAEGCSNYCTYCIIPKIRGKYRSRTIENILKEAEDLSRMGVKELILVAQDTTKYGTDIYGEKKLHLLIKELSKIKGISWIRILYCYPEEIYDELITEISVNDKVCKYIDIPLQHISNNVLKKMGRKGSKDLIVNTINNLRSRIPGLCIRTSIMVGFPGETEEDFKELSDFIKTAKFERLGVFKYSKEEGTPASLMENQIDQSIKEKREDQIMLLQQHISHSLNKSKIGNIYKVIIEGFNGQFWYGRSYEMSPEIDGAIYFRCDKILNVGNFINIKIIDCSEYDLIGVVCYESSK